MSPTATSAGRTRDLRAVAIVPARLGSTRLARKMLLAETGRPLFEHTARNVAAAGVFARVVVATDSAEIVAAAERAGIEGLMTRSDHPSGTDRVEEAWTILREGGESADVVVGVQGDEPDLDGADLAGLVRAFDDPEIEVATLAVAFEDEGAADSPHTVKVVCDRRGDALYFSRARIPAAGHAPAPTGAPGMLRRHIGVYAFTPAALARFCALPRGTLEACEGLEQLRWLEAGLQIRVVEAVRAPLGIDTRADYERFVARWRARATRAEAAPGGAASAATGAREHVRWQKAREG